MNKRITIELTEDQIRAIDTLINDWQMGHGLMYWQIKTPEQEKEYAFLLRLRKAVKAELVR